MDKSNSKGGLVVGILIGIIIMLVVGIGLFATNIISFSGDTNTNEIKKTNNEENTNTDKEQSNVDFNSFLSDVSGSLGHLVVIHTLPQYGNRRDTDYLKNVDDRQTFIMEYILKDKNNEKNFVKVNGESNQKDDSLDVYHETTIAYYPYNLFNVEYKKIFGENFKAADRVTTVDGATTYDKSEDYVYYINKRAGFNGYYVTNMKVENTSYNESNNNYKATINMSYSDRLSESIGAKSETAEIIYTIVNNNIILKSFIIK